jgi:plasmid stabilization system protein ParE
MWAQKAKEDLQRLYEFLQKENQQAANKVVRALVVAPRRLVQHPRIGELLDEFAPREVRRWLVGNYEIRYELQAETLIILRLFHSREQS